MDMKRILEKLDQVGSKPSVDSADMKRFVSIVNEGANPHKVALPVQMAMQHYQEVTLEKTPVKESLLKKYFAEAQDVAVQAAEQQAVERQQQLSMYAQRIAKKVLEGHKDDAWTRDYKSSVSGMGHKDSLAYQMDGGANDEGWDDEEPRDHRQHSDVPHDVHINGKKWKSFGSHSHASNVAKKIKGATVHKSVEEGVFGDIKDAIVGKSAEDWAKTSTQMAALIKMRAQYPNNAELEKRISDLAFRLNQGSGEVMAYDPKTGQQSPKIPQPPKQ